MNNIKNKYILKYNNMIPNIYSYDNQQVKNFYEHASKELGVNLRIRGKKNIFFYRGKRIGHMSRLLPSSTSKLAYKICKDKMLTEDVLKNMGVSTLMSYRYSENEKEKAYRDALNSGYNSFVIKPVSLAGGKGIELDITKEEFSEAWNRNIDYQKKSGVMKIENVIQPFINGFDIRISITEGVFSSALWRLPAHIVGNGNDSISSLIEAKNKIRKTSLYFKRFLYDLSDSKITRKLLQQSYNLHSIPQENEIVFLSDLGNLTAGAESIDVTKLISKDLKTLALKATAAIPGLHTAGIDILTEDFTSDRGFVIEVNTNANHQVHHFPYKGKVRKPFKDIIHVMLVKHKISESINLKLTEKKINKDLQLFNNYRDDYYNKFISNYYFDKKIDR